MDDRYYYEYQYPGAPVIEKRKHNWPLHIGLFAATFVTTSFAGAMFEGADIFKTPWKIYLGFPFSLTLMLILLSHEMGHYIASRVHKVDATLPYFIPAPPIPFIIGTFGAFIKMRGALKNKAALMDIGAAGPLVGFVLSIIAIAIGLPGSKVVEGIQVQEGALRMGEPLAFKFIEWLTFSGLSPDAEIVLHPIAFAGWLGLFVTSLNLLPIGQLDGGHISYALFGKKSFWVGLAMIPLLLLSAYFLWPGWGLWAILATVFGLKHPPPIDPYAGIGPRRKLIGWISLAVFILSFTPVPFDFT